MSALQTTSDILRLLSDPTRMRLLALVAESELSVAELTRVLQAAQSRVSTHLGKLRDAGLVCDRREGSSSFYSLNDTMPAEAKRLWRVMRETLEDSLLDQDAARAKAIVAARTAGQSWADAVAGRMDRHYSPGRTWEATTRGLLGLCSFGDVLDVASGDGALAALIAPRARSVTCLDISPRVIAAAEKRLKRFSNVRFETGDMAALPFDDESFDAVMLMSCLTYADDVEQVLREARRVLRPGGALTGVTLERHTHSERVAAYNHANLGQRAPDLARQLGDNGLDVARCEITSREHRAPHFQVITFHANRPNP